MTKQTLHSLIAILFIISGATGLVYQIVWFKYLSLFLGNTTQAQTIVLATFMGGLAIGSALWGRSADKIRHPMFLYGVLELGIGAYCFLFPSFLNVVKNIFYHVALASSLEIGGTMLLSLKLFVAIVTILLPTIMMGGTLPVLVKTISERVDESGRNVAVLYFLNSFGAVIGSLMCGFFFIRVMGLEGTIYGAAITNLLIGVAALLLSRVVHHEPHAPSTPLMTEIFPVRKQALALLVAFCSGCAAMMYEIGWLRLLIPVFGSSTFSFSLILIAFISGITIGSWFVAKSIDRIKNLFGFLAVCQLGVVLSLLVSLPLYGRIPYLFWNLSTLFSRTDSAYALFLFVEFFFCFLIMLAPTIFLGMTLPVASRIASTRIEKLGATIGNVFSINTIGAVLGLLLAGLVLIPAIGIRHTMEIGIVLNAVAMLAVVVADRISKKIMRLMFSLSAVVALVLYFLFATDWNQLLTMSGVFRHISERTASPKNFATFVAHVNDKKDLYYKEGSTATVAVVEATAFGVKQNILLINGKADASSEGDLPTQILLAQLPMMLHPNVDTALVIGLGSGITVGSLLTHPIHRVDCVEISPEVVEASKYFSRANNNCLEDKRVHLFNEDAIALLHLTRTKYDVIVSEPSNPWIAGIGNLYTEEFFRDCKTKLRKNGMMVQWFHLYEIDDDILKLVLRTFRSVFPSVTVWQSLRHDIIMIGSAQALNIEQAALQEKFAMPLVKKDLQRINIVDVPSLLSLQVLSPQSVDDYSAYGVFNTENKPYLEYWAPRAFFMNRGVPEYLQLDERMKFNGDSLLFRKYIRAHPLNIPERLNVAFLHSISDRGNLQLAYSFLNEHQQNHPNEIPILSKLADVSEQLGQTETSKEYLHRLSLEAPNDVRTLERYAWLLYSTERIKASPEERFNIDEPVRLLQRCITLAGDTLDRVRIRLGDVYFGSQQFHEAAQQYLRALELRSAYRGDASIPYDVLFMKLAHSLYNNGEQAKALEFAAQASLWNDDSEEIKDFMYNIMMLQLKK